MTECKVRVGISGDVQPVGLVELIAIMVRRQ
jgi:hypothetical protein